MIRIGIFGAESFSDEMKKRIHDGLGIEAFDIYGMTETGGVGTTLFYVLGTMLVLCAAVLLIARRRMDAE